MGESFVNFTLRFTSLLFLLLLADPVLVKSVPETCLQGLFIVRQNHLLDLVVVRLGQLIDVDRDDLIVPSTMGFELLQNFS